MTAVLNYRDLLAWQRAMDLAELVYRLTESFPRRESDTASQATCGTRLSPFLRTWRKAKDAGVARSFMHHLSICSRLAS